MPADKAARLAQITRTLLDATARCDWRLIAATDRELAQLSADLAQRDGLSQAELAALRQLQRVHAQAMACCNDEMQRLDTAMDSLRQHREGLIAYDLVNDKDEVTRS